jgi:hypothetical protein
MASRKQKKSTTTHLVRWVVDLRIQVEGNTQPPAAWKLKRAIVAALRTLNHKRHGLDAKFLADAFPIEGSTAAAIELVRCLREETQTRVDEKVWEHEEEKRHDD